MRRVRELGIDNRWWAALAMTLVITMAAFVLGPARWHPFGHNPREAVALLPGLTLEDAPPPQKGLIVTSLQSDSEAASANIVVGDDIEGLDGHPVRNLGEAIKYLRRDRDSTIVLEVAHGHAIRDVRLRRAGEFRHGA